jgi:hypothetical protein
MDTPMEIGFFFWPYMPALIRRMAAAAQRYRYDVVGVADTPGGSRSARSSRSLPATSSARATLSRVACLPSSAPRSRISARTTARARARRTRTWSSGSGSSSTWRSADHSYRDVSGHGHDVLAAADRDSPRAGGEALTMGRAIQPRRMTLRPTPSHYPY